MKEVVATALKSCYADATSLSSDLPYLRCLTELIQADTPACSISPPSSQLALFTGYCSQISALRNCNATTQESRVCKALVDGVFVSSFKCSLSSAEMLCIAIAVALVISAIALWLPWRRLCWPAVTLEPLPSVLQQHSGFYRQFRASLQRVLLTKSRNMCRTTLELLTPCGLCAFLVVMVHIKPREALMPDIEDSMFLRSVLSAINPSLGHCTTLTLSLEACIPSDMLTQFYSRACLVVAMFLILSLSQLVSDATAGLCRDKETRLACVAGLMGLKQAPASLGWLVGHWTCSSPLALMLCLELKGGSVFAAADFGELLLFLLLMNSSLFGFCTAVASLFSRSKVASWASPCLFAASGLVFFQVYQRSTTAQMFASLLPTVAFSLGVYGQLQAAMTGTGMCRSAADFFLVEDSESVIPLSSCIWMLLVDSVLFWLVGVYLHHVIPQEFGQRLPWHFPISQLWTEENGESSFTVSDCMLNQACIEQPTPQQELQELQQKTVDLYGVMHNYGGHLALNGLSLTLYPNAITGLLGENGAGKF